MKRSENKLNNPVLCKQILEKLQESLAPEQHCKIPSTISIEQRPEIIEKRIRLDDYEIDTFLGKQGSGAILTIVDSVSHLQKPVTSAVVFKKAHFITLFCTYWCPLQNSSRLLQVPHVV